MGKKKTENIKQQITSSTLLRKWIVRAKRRKKNLRPSWGKIKKDATPKTEAGEYRINIPNLLENFIILWLFWEGLLEIENLEYCMCFPFNSKKPAFASDAKPINDIAFTNVEDGAGNNIVVCNTFIIFTINESP